MTRAMTIALALAACALCVEAALFVAGVAGTWFHAHRLAPWFVPACNLFLVFCFVFTGRSAERRMAAEEGLAPLVRRDPKTGLRQL
jgi:hypothetical protein